MEILKVSGTSVPRSVAGAIAAVLRREEVVAVQAVGAMAVNQAVKSMAIAREYLVEDQWDLSIAPSFEHIEIDGAERTAIKFTVTRKPRPLAAAPVVAAPVVEAAPEVEAAPVVATDDTEEA